ncbi:MAG: carbon-nitrogen hydrolase family protein, partial [Thaumarchaeota archaeon]|nr:carbon-nitrogen hydrolase family protein [Candidatus Calditenuaceae archaeon]MDW8186950.1 carbon-nitrogen hydrolase family protein [Nitrososphaerota archaeon]
MSVWRLVRVAMVQPRVEETPLETIKWVCRRMVEDDRPADLYLLPEAWVHRAPVLDIRAALEASEEAVRRLRELARSMGSWVVAGGLYVMSDDKPAMRVPVISPEGEVVGHQDKVHPFKEERLVLRRGREFRTFEAAGVRFGILVCHDVVYPEAARTLVLKGAEVLLNPSRIRREGVEPWHVYLRARALENRCPVVGCNLVLGNSFNGMSLAVDLVELRGGVVVTEEVTAGEEPTVLTVELAPERL